MNTVESPSLAAVQPSAISAPVIKKVSDGLAFKEKLGYGLGDTASHFVWDMVGFWLLFFLHGRL